jgi:hypothetical protein
MVRKISSPTTSNLKLQPKDNNILQNNTNFTKNDIAKSKHYYKYKEILEKVL